MCIGVEKKVVMVHWMWWIYQSALRRLFTKFPIWYGVGGFLVRLISLLPIVWMCIIWLKVDMFPWRLFFTVFLCLRSVMTWIILHVTVRFLVYPVSSFNKKKTLLTWMALRWNCGRFTPSPKTIGYHKVFSFGSN